MLLIRRRFYWTILWAALAFASGVRCGFCQTRDPADRKSGADEPRGLWNIESPTLGGQQFWTDVEWCADWRVQKNVFTGHYRLLDPRDTRMAWGTEVDCRNQLESYSQQQGFGKPAGHVVILLHGLIRSRDSMQPFSDYLAGKGQWTIVNWQYASTREPIESHAVHLRMLIDRLGPEVTRIDLVAHSLGNLVIRRYLYDTWDAPSGEQGDSRLKRLVMLGPPNQGSRSARLLRNVTAFNVVCGPSGHELSTTWNRFSRTLAVPKFEFGIVAGGEVDGAGFDNYLLPGDDDFTVSVAETRLPGAADTLLVPAFHGSLMRRPDVHEATLRFLRSGSFRPNGDRQPIMEAPLK